MNGYLAGSDSLECLVLPSCPLQLLAEDAKVNDDHRRKLASVPPTELEVTAQSCCVFQRSHRL